MNLSVSDDNKPESESVRKIRKRKPLLWAIVRTGIGLMLFYYVTATAVPALVSHSGKGGKLSGMPAAGIRVLQAYQTPMDYLGAIPPLDRAFDFGIDLWWRILDPPGKKR
jgi:hypothetical protein